MPTIDNEEVERRSVKLTLGADITHNLAFADFCEKLARINYDGTLLEIRFEHGRVDVSRIMTTSRHDEFQPHALNVRLQALQGNTEDVEDEDIDE